MDLLLGDESSRRNAIGLLLGGAIPDAAGNFLSLSWWR
jgi:hypothetical protein